MTPPKTLNREQACAYIRTLPMHQPIELSSLLPEAAPDGTLSSSALVASPNRFEQHSTCSPTSSPSIQQPGSTSLPP